MIHSFEYCANATKDVGIAEQVSGFMVKASGLIGGTIGEGITFENDVHGRIMAINNHVEILVLSRTPIIPGTKCSRTGKPITVTCGEGLMGEVITSLGYMLSEDKLPSKHTENRVIENSPMGMIGRAPVAEFLETGMTAVDLIVPIGRGQRELVIGDRTTGKTHTLLQMLTTQAKKGTICIWGAIGKRKSDIKAIETLLTSAGVMKQSLIIASDSFASPGEIFLTPYTAMTFAEYFRDQGHNVVLILDDLTTHAKYYREISLLFGQFPGRESYPGDIFHIHSKLLERAGSFIINEKPKSITCFPVAESANGEMIGYIQTNLMSMTDGHLYFDKELYFKGVRPAINVFLSVTRVGRQTQSSLQRDIGTTALMILKKYENAQSFLRFGPDISTELQQVITLGDHITAFLDQTGSWSMDNKLANILFALITIGAWDGTNGQAISQRYTDDGEFRNTINQLSEKAQTLKELASNIKKINKPLI